MHDSCYGGIGKEIARYRTNCAVIDTKTAIANRVPIMAKQMHQKALQQAESIALRKYESIIRESIR
jgi:hypothetical protein